MPSSNPPQFRRITVDGQRKLAPVFINRDEIAVAVHLIPNQVVLQRVRWMTGPGSVFIPRLPHISSTRRSRATVASMRSRNRRRARSWCL